MTGREWAIVVLGLAGTFFMPWPSVEAELRKPNYLQMAGHEIERRE